LSQEYIMLVLLSAASGIQNALITYVSKSVVRTTHLTGLTTDLGVGIIRLFSSPNSHTKKEEQKATGMRLGIIISFILGSWLGGLVFYYHHYWGFLIPIILTSFYLYLSIKNNKELLHLKMNH
ncbi:MAG: DUF1275 domain-containing protein, partial [Bdellovibrionales bacterium]|nr:DUF1275 domain-containing protein [Bdellovibrionales bacterium]